MRFICFGALLFLIFSCNSSTSENKNSASKPAPILFPITEIIEGDIYNAAQQPVTPLEKIIINNRTDSFLRKREEIKNWAAPFLNPTLDSAALSKYFIEKSFLDKTIDAFTIIYERKDNAEANTPWQICNLYIDPKTNKVEKIYLVKDSMIDGKMASVQLTWNINNKAMMRILIPKSNDSFDITERQLIWGTE